MNTNQTEIEQCWKDCNTIKTREDSRPYHFVRDKSKGESTNVCNIQYMFCPNETDDGQAPWGNNTGFSIETLRERIEPWLTSLFQSEHLSLLVGSGLSTGIAKMAGVSSQSMDPVPFQLYSDQISKEAQSLAKLRGKANCEDYFRVATELIRGLKILRETEKANQLESELKDHKRDFISRVLVAERALAEAHAGNGEKAWKVLVEFLMSFASRTGTRDRLHIFTTNYDRIIEEGADLAGLHLLDRFTGALAPVFRASRLNLDLHYNPPGIRGEPRYLEGVARFTKLHGSVDWVQCNARNADEMIIRKIGLPFGATSISPYLNSPGLPGEDAAFDTLIYPTAAKDRETAEYPFVDLFRDFAAAVCQPNSSIVTFGYGFGDDHINRVLRDMLTIPSTHLVVISFDSASGRIPKFYWDNQGRRNQISLLIGKDVAALETLTNNFLPKSAIDFVTSRMAELLATRHALHESRKWEDLGTKRDDESKGK